MSTPTRIRRVPKTSVTVRATALGSSKKRADTSRQIHREDAFANTGTLAPITPPYDPYFLSQCVERSNALGPCISAIVTNVGMSGFTVNQLNQKGEIDPAEQDELQSFIDSANSSESLASVHAKIVLDFETFGYAFLEVVRDIKNRLALVRAMHAIDTRLLPKDSTPISVDYKMNRGSRVVFAREYRTFRRYAQIVNGRVRYFKEFGDPRPMNMDTGEYGAVSHDKEATEVIHIRQNSPDPYGVPKWINQLPSILGSREAEECNLRYFQDNTVPPMILSVAGGRLTKQSYQELKSLLEKQAIGADRQNKILLIEAIPERESLDDKGTVSLQVDKLADARQSDGLFKEYDEGNQAKIRSSFRLPPVAIGYSQEQNFATARVSAFITESQVYLPMRNFFDEIYNKLLFNGPSGLGLKTCCVLSQVPLTSDPETIIKSLTALNVMGGITPREANRLGNQVLQIDLSPYPKEGEPGYAPWMDSPILFVSKGKNTHDEQSQKDQDIKDLEEDGDVSLQQPENGEQ